MSESTARKWLAEGNGSLKYLMKGKTAKLLGENWGTLPENQQQYIYETLRAKVEENREQGWTSRL